jgi:hypothetical protein
VIGTRVGPGYVLGIVVIVILIVWLLSMIM